MIQSCPGAESLICYGRNAREVEVYYFKHKLLSKAYFQMYAEEQDSTHGRYALARKLIEYTAKWCQGAKEKECVTETLLNILIRNRDREINHVSQLLSDISMPERQRELIKYLAEQFQSSADKILNELDIHDEKTDTTDLRIVSHAYAHLGKLYANYPENYVEASKYLDLAEQYIPDKDAYIYHMHGRVLYYQLRATWESVSDPTASELIHYQETVNKALDLFAETSELGHTGYGITGQLDLLYEYIKFIYKINGVSKKEDLRKLTSEQVEYQIQLMDTLDEAKQYDNLDDTALSMIERKEEQLRSEVLMGDIGKTIEYYHNAYTNYNNSGDTDRALSALQALVSAKIQKAKWEYMAAGSKEKSFYMMISDRRALFDHIEVLLPSLYNENDFSSHTKRTTLFRHWFQLAKMLDISINAALIKIQYWVESEDAFKGKKNPEPYYYKAILLYLEIIDGGNRGNELDSTLYTISTMERDQKFDSKRGRVERIKDILVDGTGMGRLLDVSDCGTTSDIANRILVSKKTPVSLSGSVASADYWGAEISIDSVSALRGHKIKSEIGRLSKNTLSEEQVNDKVKFLTGFTVLGMRAIGDSVKDQDSGEVFDVREILATMRGGPEASVAKSKEKQSVSKIKRYDSSSVEQDNASRINSSNVLGTEERKIFYPKYIWYNKQQNDEVQYLNGTVGNAGDIGGISVDYFKNIFGENNIEAYGGIESIFDELIHNVREIDVIATNYRIDNNGKKQYTLRLYNENIDLSQLLQLQKSTVALSQNMTQPAQTEVIQLPDFNGRRVKFIPNDLTLSKPYGKFKVDGVEYEGSITNVKTPKDKKKAQKYNGEIPVIVMGKPQSGKYSVKMQ